MRPRPKIYQPNLSSLAALSLLLILFIFALCYENPNYADSEVLVTTCWWAPAFAFAALADCAVEKFADPMKKSYLVFAFLASAAELFLLSFFIFKYFEMNQSGDPAYLAPRIGVSLVLFLLGLLGFVFKIMRSRKSPFLNDPITYPSLLGLVTGLGLLALALAVWSLDVGLNHLWGGEFYPVLIAFFAGLAEIGESIFVLQSKEKPLEETLLKIKMGTSFVGAFGALIAVFMTIGFYDYSSLSYVLFYWTLFPSVGMCLLSGSAGAYYAYVNHRLTN